MKQMNLCGTTSLKVISGALQSLKKDAKNIYIFQGLTKHCEIMWCTVFLSKFDEMMCVCQES